MADLSATHFRSGGFWLPRADYPEPQAAVAEPDTAFADLDITRYHAALKAKFEAAAASCDIPTLSADARQYASGVKRGLSDALRLLDVSRRPPEAPETPSNGALRDEEPHT